MENKNGASLDPIEPGELYKPDIQRLAHHLIQSIIQEMPEPPNTTARTDAFFDRLDEIDQQNGLHPLEFNKVFYLFVDNYNGGID